MVVDVIGRAASDRLSVRNPPLIVANSRLVVVEKDLGDEVAAAADARLLEHMLQVLLDCVGRDGQGLADLRGGTESGDTALSLGWGINVVRRDHEGAWRFAIALIDPERLNVMEERR